MNNRPFLVNSTNVTDESFFTATPTYINGQNLFVSQEKQRKIFDTLNTSVTGMSPPSLGASQFYPGNFIQADRYYGPGGVVFTFPPAFSHPPAIPAQVPPQINRWPSNPNQFPPPPNVLMGNPVNYRNIPQLDMNSLQYQNQLSHDPFCFQPQQLPTYTMKFHLNKSTSSSDLLNAPNQVPGSQGTPDFRNLSGLMYQRNCTFPCPQSFPTVCTNGLPNNATGFTFDPNLSNNPPSSIKRLVINKPVERPTQHVADVLDQEKCSLADDEDAQKMVTFSNSNQTDKTENDQQTDKMEKDQQPFFICKCNNADEKNEAVVKNENINNGNTKNGNMKNGNMKNGNMKNGNMKNGNINNDNYENDNNENDNNANDNNENENVDQRRNPVRNFFRKKCGKYDSDKYSSDLSENEPPKQKKQKKTNNTSKKKIKKTKEQKNQKNYDTDSDSE